MKKLYSLLIISLLAFSCQRQHQNIVDKADYNNLIESPQARGADINTEIDFWTKRTSKSPNSYLNISQLARLYSQRFRADGAIEDIHKSDSLYHQVLKLNPFNNASTFRALSANAVTKHQFIKAKDYALAALKEGEDQAASYYMLFDALMELGEFPSARAALNRQKSKTSFDYLARASKLADHDGDLNQAISLMEKAYDRVKSDKSVYSWSISNLGDMYGHAGRIEDSYQAYIKVLNHNPQHWHSWKGLAWINFAHDNNMEEAKRILKHIDSKSNDPQIKLMLAEIAEFEGNLDEALSLKKNYYAEASSESYFGMHNKYLILLESEDLSMTEAAIARASSEQEKRPTPQVYDLLAWSYLQHGNPEKALALAESFVEGKSFEPEVLYHLGVIYKTNGQKRKGNSYLKEALESEFELGPLTTERIRENLKS